MSIRYQADTHEIVIALGFPDRRKDGVKSCGARFRGDSKTWHLSADLTEEQVRRLQAEGFALPDGWRPAGAAAPQAPRAAAPAAPRPAVRAHAEPAVEDTIALSAPLRGQTVSEVAASISNAIKGSFPTALWVRGVARVRGQGRWTSGLFFDLADCDAKGNELATMNAIIWAANMDRVLRPLRDAGLELTDGLPVCLRATIRYNARQGRADLVVEQFDPAASLGEIALKRDAVVRAITAEGLARSALDRRMPSLPMRIALVSSVGSDGYIDFRKQLAESGYGFSISDFDVRVQGEALEPTVLDAFRRIEAAASSFDLVVVTRGGGGKADLSSWDNLAVARAVACCPVKVLVAIGHTADATALDRIALSRATPTDAGRYVAGLVAEADDRAASLFERIAAEVSHRLAEQEELLDHLASQTARLAAARVRLAEQGLHLVARSVRDRVKQRVRLEGASLQRYEQALLRVPATLQRQRSMLHLRSDLLARGSTRLVADRSRQLAQTSAQLGRAGQRRADHAAVRLQALERSVRLADPGNILRRGFALVRGSDGGLLTSVTAVEQGAVLTVELRDGRVRTRVEQTTTELTDNPKREQES